jgi:phosphinothricin acetyltransferase
MQAADWPAVATIYAAGIATGLATFETQVPSWEQWNANHRAEGRLVAKQGDILLGWAALSSVSARECYRGVCEVSIYIADSARGQGIGKALLLHLIQEARAQAIWTLQAGIFARNSASLALHRACGFREVGYRERIAQRDGEWMDTVLMELRL